MAVPDLTMPILSPVFAQRSAAAERLMTFATGPLAHSRPPASHALSRQISRRLSVAGAPGVLASQIAQRYAPGEHAAAPIDLLLPFAPRTHQLATARWAGPRWPTTPLQRASAEPSAPAMPEEGLLLHDLAGAGWGDAQPQQGGHDLPMPPPPAGGSALPLAQRLPDQQAAPADPPAQPATLRRVPAVAQSSEEVPRSADTALHIQVEQPEATAAQPLSDAPAPAKIARAAEPEAATTPFVRETSAPEASAAAAPHGQEQAMPGAPAELLASGQLLPASPTTLARTAELTLRPATLRPTALVSMRVADPLARMGFAPASGPDAPATAAPSLARSVADTATLPGLLAPAMPGQAGAVVARTSAPLALEEAPDMPETQQASAAESPVLSDAASQDLVLSEAMPDIGAAQPAIARRPELPASAGLPAAPATSDALAGELPLRRATIVPVAAASRSAPGAFAARVVQRVLSGNRPSPAAASGDVSRLPELGDSWIAQTAQPILPRNGARNIAFAQPGAISGELPIAAQRSFFASAGGDTAPGGWPAAETRPSPDIARQAAPGEAEEATDISSAWPQPPAWSAPEAHGAAGAGPEWPAFARPGTPVARTAVSAQAQRMPDRAGSFGSLALAVQRSTSAPEAGYPQSSGGELDLATPAALVAQHTAALVQRQAEPAPDTQPPAGNGPRGSAPAQAGAPPSPQQVEQIANQVYDHLRRRLLIDRERRGLW